MMLECIKEGFNIANKNLQLVLIRISVTIINVVVFVISLGIPIVAAVVYMGFDLANARDMLPFIARNPLGFVSRYLVLLFLIGIAFIFYLIFVTMFYLYAMGGTLGVLRSSAVNIQYKFNLSSFFKEAKRNFGGLLWLLSLVSLGCTALFIVLVLSGGIITAAIQIVGGGRGILEVFFSSFAVVSMIVFSIIFFLACFVFIGYSMIVLVTNRKSVMDCIKQTFDFLKQKPEAFLLYFMLILGIIAVNFLFVMLKGPFSMLPFLGTLMNSVLWFFSFLVQSYLSIVLWSSLIVYYVRGTDYPVYSALYEI